MAKKVTFTVSMDAEADRDLLRWLERQENRSAAVREVLRAHLGGGDVTLGDVYRAVQDLRAEIRSRTIAAGPGCGEAVAVDEPAAAAAALEQLGVL